jgi:hypothetical protein
MMIEVLKKFRAKSYSNTNSKEELKRFLQSEVGKNILEPLAITKKVHNCNFTVDSQKAKEKIGYENLVSFNAGMKKLKDSLMETNR